MKADLIALHLGMFDEIRIEAKNSYAQEFLTDELELRGTGDTVKSMVCCSTHVAAETLSRAIAEGLHVGLWEPSHV